MSGHIIFPLKFPKIAIENASLMLLYSLEAVMDINADSTVSSSVMIVRFSFQLFALRYIVTIEQFGTLEAVAGSRKWSPITRPH